MEGFKILTFEKDFPEIILVNDIDRSKSIAVEIMTLREISPFLMSISFSLEKFTAISLENGYSNIMIFIVVKPILISTAVIDEIKKLKQNFESDKLKIELIFGRIEENNFKHIVKV